MARPTRIYGLLDCAVDPTIHRYVVRLQEDGAAACLFDGRLADELLEVSPYLAELTPHDPLSRAWRRRGWGKSWGLLITSPDSLPTVRRRLRHFTQARLPDGQGPVLFRFWDPRVFRVYLPLVEPDEIGAWFEDIESYTVETEDGEGSIRYSLVGGALHVETDLARPAVS